MTDYPKFVVKYVAQLPLTDTLCPICQKGYVKQGKFSPLCFDCHSAFKIDRFAQKSGATSETTKDMIIIDKLDEINGRLDKLALFLKEKLGKDDEI